MANTKRPLFLLLLIPACLLFAFVVVRNRNFLHVMALQTNKRSVATVGTTLVTNAKDITGPLLSLTDPPSLRRFETVLPPTFQDENGVYPGLTKGESVIVHLGLNETADADRAQFRALPELDQFGEDSIGPWHLTVARDRNRWVARAIVQDPESDRAMVHAIECIAAPSSTHAFWEGCKAMITHARITVIPGNTLTR